MLTENIYTYTPVWFNEQWLIDHFQIKAALNAPPYIPNNPSPANGSTEIDINADLGWSGGDPNDDPVTYDIYFGTTSPPSQIICVSQKRLMILVH